jgi:hypothetical protein
MVHGPTDFWLFVARSQHYFTAWNILVYFYVYRRSLTFLLLSLIQLKLSHRLVTISCCMIRLPWMVIINWLPLKSCSSSRHYLGVIRRE